MKPAAFAPFLASFVAAACAATNPAPPPPEETLLVLNSGDPSLTYLPVDPGDAPESFRLGLQVGPPTFLATQGTIGVITLGGGDAALVIDLPLRRVARSVILQPGSGAGAAVVVNDSVIYVANPGLNTVTRVNLDTGDTASVVVGQVPAAIAVARGRVFVVNANVALPCVGPLPCVLGESWLTVIDPVSNQRAGGRDSIPLPGPGNALFATVGGDGFIYVMNAGDGADDPGRLSIVDPVTREEVGSFGGFGLLPGALATDGRERLFIASRTSGLMEFNTRIRRVVRGAGSGIPVVDNIVNVVDGGGRVYAVESGACGVTGPAARVRIYRADLVELRVVPAGLCAVAAAVVRLPRPEN